MLLDVMEEAGVRVLEGGYEIDAATVQLADVVIQAEGRLGPLPEPAGTELRIEVQGPDLSWVGRLAREDLGCGS